MTQSTDIHSMSLAVGEVRGQMRELIHGVNNMSAKMDAISTQLAQLLALPAEVAALEMRVTQLEADKNRRDGAMSFGGWLFRTPLLGWIATAAVAAWALIKDRGHP